MHTHVGQHLKGIGDVTLMPHFYANSNQPSALVCPWFGAATEERVKNLVPILDAGVNSIGQLSVCLTPLTLTALPYPTSLSGMAQDRKWTW